MRETRERKGRAEIFPPKSFIKGEDTFTVLVWGFYITPAKKKYKKNQNQKIIQGIKWEENQKKGTKVNKSNRQQEGTVNKVNSGSRRQFRNLRNFAGCENFAILPNFTTSLFLLLSTPLSSGFESAILSSTRILCVAKISQSCQISLLPIFFYFLLLFPLVSNLQY